MRRQRGPLSLITPLTTNNIRCYLVAYWIEQTNKQTYLTTTINNIRCYLVAHWMINKHTYDHRRGVGAFFILLQQSNRSMYKKTEQTCLKNIVPSAGTGVRISRAKSSRVFGGEGGRAALDTSSAARSEAHRAVGSCAECSAVRVVELRVLVSED